MRMETGKKISRLEQSPLRVPSSATSYWPHELVLCILHQRNSTPLCTPAMCHLLIHLTSIMATITTISRREELLLTGASSEIPGPSPLKVVQEDEGRQNNPLPDEPPGHRRQATG